MKVERLEFMQDFNKIIAETPAFKVDIQDNRVIVTVMPTSGNDKHVRRYELIIYENEFILMPATGNSVIVRTSGFGDTKEIETIPGQSVRVELL